MNEERLKDLMVALVVLTMLTLVCRYIWQAWKHKIDPENHKVAPTLSTWIIFVAGTSLSLATYVLAQEHDLRSGVLNTIDAFGCFIIMSALILLGYKKALFKPFEKWYLAGVGAIIIYGVITGDAWKSNILAQILITIGYAPTIHTMVTKKKNTESFVAWGLICTASFLALYPSLIDGKPLAAVYSIRSLISTAAMLYLMAYYKFRAARA